MKTKKLDKYLEEPAPKYVPDVNIMAMSKKDEFGKKEYRCPGCLSKNLKVVDHDLANEEESHFGTYKFIKKCKSCGMLCKVIKNIEY